MSACVKSSLSGSCPREMSPLLEDCDTVVKVDFGELLFIVRLSLISATLLYRLVL